MQAVSKQYNRRLYVSPKQYIAAVMDILNHTSDLKRASRSKRVDHAFAEKIMLAVTQVNDCRYCNYGHTKSALQAGVPQEEIARIATGELGEFPEDEATAFFFGQHYAEAEGQPDPLALQRFVDCYGKEKADDILAYIRMIMFGNLMGNTFDAFLNRFRGRPVPGSSLLSELTILGLTVIGFLPFGLVMAFRMLGTNILK